MKFKVTIGEETHEIDQSSLEVPEGFVLMTQSTLDAQIEARLAKQKRSLLEDAETAETILRKHGVPLDETGKPKIPKPHEFDEAAERERIKAAILSAEVAPKDQLIGELQAKVGTLLGSRKRAEILQAAQAAGVQDWALKGMGEGQPAMIENMISPMLEHDTTSDMFAVIHGRQNDEITFRPATKPGKPWAGPTDLFEGLKKDPSYTHLFKDTRPGASGFDKPGVTNGRTQSREDLAMGRVDIEKLAKGEVSISD